MAEIGSLKRSLWGWTDSFAAHLAAQQRQQLTQMQEDAAETHHRQVHEIECLRKRVELLRQSTEMLTQRLAKTRATSSAATRMVEHHLASLTGEHSAAIGELTFQSARASAELQLERQAFRTFLAELHRLLAGRGALPEGLEPLLPTLPPPERADWQPLLAGKVVSHTVTTTGGRVIAAAGEQVSAETITAAEEHGLLPALLQAVRLS